MAVSVSTTTSKQRDPKNAESSANYTDRAKNCLLAWCLPLLYQLLNRKKYTVSGSHAPDGIAISNVEQDALYRLGDYRGAAHQGDSEGEPRGLEDPAQRVEDIKAAVSFLSTQSDVATDRIGLLGICASGAYSLSAAATDHRVRAVAAVSCADISRQFRCGADGSQPSTLLQQMLATAAAARTDEARGQPPATFPIFPAAEEEARNAGRHVFEGWQYYCTPRAAHPRSAKAFTWNCVDRIATFDCFAYDREEFVTPAITRLADFFGSNLGGAGPR
ncbi:dienelactone hydrolase family protein [Rhodomicrobium vannielii ATCC 17100]|uniref:alpha/beta hydrolase n=1 Tax=Rhodomicrobium vannielii TaxID=1069 RepID=UPI00191B5FBF|nr:CocE/NonD family hydrolase [Rhodomicrobium vannielii]MBJ7533140.1 dienelactone hydrolase family protein [Rhodomicrobium vannielii ATCC 17100]